jgi:hypothetical protein
MEKAHKAPPTKSRLVSRKKCKFFFFFHFLCFSFAKNVVFFSLSFFKVLLSRLPCVPKHWFMFQHDSTLFTSSLFFSWMLKRNWNSFLFQRQRLMQVNLHVCRGSGWSWSLVRWWINGLKLLASTGILNPFSFVRFLSRESLHSRITAKCEVNKSAWIELHYIEQAWRRSSKRKTLHKIKSQPLNAAVKLIFCG